MKKTPEQIVDDIQNACAALGWNVAFNESTPGITGLIVGQPEYVEETIVSLPDGDQYVIYASGAEIDSELH